MLLSLVRNVNLSGARDGARRLTERLYDRRVMFVHVPKCGGTSLSHVLRARYALSQAKVDEAASNLACTDVDKNAWFDFKRRLVRYEAGKGTHFIQGHFCVDGSFLETYGERYRIVTVLREPVDRLISHYHFDVRYNTMSFDDFLASPQGITEARVLCHFFGELAWDAPPDAAREQGSVQRAVRNLDALDAVGIVEAPELTDAAFESALGFRPRIPRRNVGRTRQERPDVGDEARARVLELCAQDLEIYAAFDRRAAA